MKTNLLHSIWVLILISCNQSPEEVQKVINEDLIKKSEKVMVFQSSQYNLTIDLPKYWKASSEQGRWIAKADCSEKFCPNIVHYYIQESPEVGNTLIEEIVQELKEVYGSTFVLISTSPIYPDPTQFSIAYAFGKENIYITGYTFAVQYRSDLHVFEVLDEYKAANELEEKLRRASDLCGTIKIEVY